MFQNSARAYFGAFLLSTLLAGAASAEPWQIIQSSGPVWFGSNDTQLVSLGSNSDIPGGDMVVTGEGGRAMLMRGQQTMLIGPNTVITIPDADEAGVTTVLQRAGEVTFDVDRQQVQHFAVETPYLAAVVKGTHFQVTIDGSDALVSVERGLVQVTDLATGDYVDTAAGQFAKVNGGDAKFDIGGTGQLPVIAQGSPRAPMVAPLAADDLQKIQVRAREASGSIQALNSSGDDNGSGLVAISTSGGGNGGGTGGMSGGNGTGVSGTGSTSGDRVMFTTNDGSASGRVAPQTDVFGGVSGAFSGRSSRPSDPVNPLVLALAAAFLTLLAVGLAYARRNS